MYSLLLKKVSFAQTELSSYNKDLMKASLLPSIDTNHETERITKFINTVVSTSKFSRLVIAVSGGIDSATCLLLATKAIGRQNIFPLILPYRSLSTEGTRTTQEVLEVAQIPSENVELIDITNSVNNWLTTLDLEASDMIRVGNIMARSRMIAIFDRAKKHHALVLGTENKSEHLLGYFTRFGDSASDIEPIQHLYKTQVYKLAKYLGVPNSIYNRAPTAGLWSRQTDEGEFGFTYQVADQVLHAIYEQKLTSKQLVKKGFTKLDVNKILQRAKANAFKHDLPHLFIP